MSFVRPTFAGPRSAIKNACSCRLYGEPQMINPSIVTMTGVILGPDYILAKDKTKKPDSSDKLLMFVDSGGSYRYEIVYSSN